MRLWLTIIILLIASVTQAQQFTGGFQNFTSSHSTGIFNDTRHFGGPGILGASDTTVQKAFQTIDASGATLITACQTSDEFCFKYSPTTLTLWMSNNQVHDWTIIVEDQFLLLESGDFLLLETGDKLVLE